MSFVFTENLRVIGECSSFSYDHSMLRSVFSGKETSNMMSSNFSLENEILYNFHKSYVYETFSTADDLKIANKIQLKRYYKCLV